MAATLYEDALDVAGSDSAKRIGHRHAALLVPGQRYVHSERQRIDFNNRLPGLRFWYFGNRGLFFSFEEVPSKLLCGRCGSYRSLNKLRRIDKRLRRYSIDVPGGSMSR